MLRLPDVGDPGEDGRPFRGGGARSLDAGREEDGNGGEDGADEE
jgi:hypothetical protein